MKMIQQNRWLPALFVLLAWATAPLAASTITFSLVPSSGDVSGPAGTTVTWGYSITNNSLTDWYLATNLNADSFQHGTPNLIFDFPEVAPGATVALYDPPNSLGLYQLTWDVNAPTGFPNTGNFTLSGQWYDGDPFAGGNFIADATDVALPYSATVTGPTGGPSTPEPTSLLLLGCGLGVITLIRRQRARLGDR